MEIIMNVALVLLIVVSVTTICLLLLSVTAVMVHAALEDLGFVKAMQEHNEQRKRVQAEIDAQRKRMMR